MVRYSQLVQFQLRGLGCGCQWEEVKFYIKIYEILFYQIEVDSFRNHIQNFKLNLMVFILYYISTPKPP